MAAWAPGSVEVLEPQGVGVGRGRSSPASVTGNGPALASMFQYQRQRRSFDRDIDRPSLSPVGSTSAGSGIAPQD